MEWILAGEKLQRARLRWLQKIHDARKVLLVGEGNGRFLEACAEQLPDARFTCVDASRTMLEIARRRWHRTGRRSAGTDFVRGLLPEWTPPPGVFDVVVTHFFLDCFPAATLERIIDSLAAAATPDAQWLLADFCEAPSGFARQRSRAILWLMYRFFRFTTHIPARRLVCPDSFIHRHGFRLSRRENSEWGLLHSDLWQRHEAP